MTAMLDGRFCLPGVGFREGDNEKSNRFFGVNLDRFDLVRYTVEERSYGSHSWLILVATAVSESLHLSVCL